MPVSRKFGLYNQPETKTAEPKKSGDAIYMRARLVRDKVLKLAHLDPSKGREEYGWLFYDDFAKNPNRYHVPVWLLHEMQQRALISTALLNWRDIEAKNPPLSDVINAAHMAYGWRVRSAQSNAWNMTDKDLKHLSIKPAAFDRLIFLLQAYCLRRAEAEGLTAESAPWLPGLKDYVEAQRAPGPQETIAAHIQMMIKDTQKIPFITRLEPSAVGPAVIEPLSHTMDQNFSYLMSVFPLVSVDPLSDYQEPPLQFDGSAFIARPTPIPEADVQVCLHYDTEFLNDAFNAMSIDANRKMQHLADLYRAVDLPLDKYGFKTGDLQAIQNVANLAPKIDLWFRMIEENDPRRIEILSEWLQKNPFTDDILQEHDLPRGHGDLYLQSLAYDELNKIIQSGKPLDAMARLMLMRLMELETGTKTPRSITELDHPDVIQAQDEYLQTFTLPRKFKALGTNVQAYEMLIQEIGALPSTYSPLKDWLPKTYARLYKYCPAALPSHHPEKADQIPYGPQLKA